MLSSSPLSKEILESWYWEKKMGKERRGWEWRKEEGEEREEDTYKSSLSVDGGSSRKAAHPPISVIPTHTVLSVKLRWMVIMNPA